MKKFLIIALFLLSIGTQAQSNISGASAHDKNNYLMVKHDYTLSYNDNLHHANWVSWVLTKSHVGITERQNDFAPDTKLPKGFTIVTPNDYVGANYDRGHLCNSQAWTDDMSDNQETFLMTNMMPQSPKCNRGTWKELEDYCQKLALEGRVLTIYAGGYLTEGHFSKKNIDVPAFCWKVVFIEGIELPICVVMPNTEDIESDWKNYEVDLAYIESITNYKF